MYTTLAEAREALEAAERDIAADGGEDAVEAAYYDLVQSVAAMCAPAVARELRRTTVGR